MTATRMPVLGCDAPHCQRTTWALNVTTIPALRQTAATHGWARFDRRDWCPQHTAQLGITHPSTR